MSRCYHPTCCPMPQMPQMQPMPQMAYAGAQQCNRGFNFTTLIALILIVLVFGSKGGYGKHDGHGEDGVLNKGILFIIAFFFLACGCGGAGGCGITGFGRY